MPICVPVKSDLFACALFVYGGNTVAIDLVGAGIPLALCVVFSVHLMAKDRLRISPRRLAIYTLLTVGLGLGGAGEYTLWDTVYGGLAVNTQLLLYTLLLPVGAIGFLLLDRTRLPNLSILQIYVVGTVGTVLSDLFRTFSGALNVSPQIIGASGPLDGVFLDGVFLILYYVATAAAYGLVLRIRRGSMPSALV